MQPRDVTLYGGPWDGMTITTEVPVIFVHDGGYGTWQYQANPADPDAPWPGTHHPSPIRYSGE